VDCPSEVALAPVGVLTEEYLGSPGSTTPCLKVTTHLRQRTYVNTYVNRDFEWIPFPLHSLSWDSQVTTTKPFNYCVLLVRLEGFEPPTLGSVDRCSNPLSYSRVGTGIPS
jgi:hypothetical protein